MELAADYGPGRGIWLSDTQLTNWDPYLFLEHNGDLLAAFDQGRGLYRYADGAGWTKLTNWEPTYLASTDSYLAVAFGNGRGVYRHDAGGWTKLASWTAESLTPVAVLP